MGFFSGSPKKGSPSVEDLIETYGDKNIKKLTKKEIEELQNKLQGRPGGKKSGMSDIGAILKDAKAGKSGKGGVGKMPKGPVNEDGSPRKSWW